MAFRQCILEMDALVTDALRNTADCRTVDVQAKYCSPVRLAKPQLKFINSKSKLIKAKIKFNN